MRHSLKNRFFKLTNGTRTHCDDDFCPLKPSDVVEVIVEELAFSDGRPGECPPTCVLLESHQSKPIQIADILIGSIKQKLKKQNNIFPLKNLDFFQKPIKCYCKKKSWSYYFI